MKKFILFYIVGELAIAFLYVTLRVMYYFLITSNEQEVIGFHNFIGTLAIIAHFCWAFFSYTIYDVHFKSNDADNR